MTLLITWLWQGIAIAVGTAALLACARRLSAASRHAIWWIAYVAVLCVPVVSMLAGLVSRAPASTAVLAIPAAPDPFLRFVAITWALFASAGLYRVIRSVGRVSRLKRAGDPLDVTLAWRLDSAKPSLPPVRVCDGVSTACALGLGRPVILLSRSLVQRADYDTLAAIVLHEHAHLERRDDWSQLLQAVIGAVAGWHPAVWYIGRQIALEREAACDDHAVGHALVARDYARSLVSAAESTQTYSAMAGGAVIPGAALSASALRRRVRRLLDGRIDRATRPALGTRVVAATAMLLAIVSATHIPAIVEFVDFAAPVPRGSLPRSSPAITAVLAPAAKTPASNSAAHARMDRPGGAAGVAELSRAAVPQDGAVPALPVPSRPMAPLDVSTAASIQVAGPSPVPVAATLVSDPTPTAPWTAIARSAEAGGRRIASAGSRTGSRAQDAGVSIGRFFSRTGKRVAGGF